MAELPSGTVTFLFTDVEDSTRLWDEFPAAMQPALARHDEILRTAVHECGGRVVKTLGDGIHAVFGTAGEAVEAALAAQRALLDEPWAGGAVVRVRMGLHTGTAEQRDGDYFGSTLNRAARLMSLAHGGQIVVSLATEELVRDELPEGAELADLGEHVLRGLGRAERVFQLTHSDLPREFAPLRSLGGVPGNLPAQVTSFVGRELDLARVIRELAETRVVTLTGVGGVGKTRLALEAAAEAATGFPDGVWLCELAGVRDPDAVVDAIVAVFGLPPRPTQTTAEALLEFLRNKELLWVLDNCEHLLSVVARLVDDVVQRCPSVRVLATSRESLNVAGERVLGVASLGIPDTPADLATVADCDAVRLFVDRAQGVKANFVLDATNADAVAHVCRRLDGIALAIELAAARVAMLTPNELMRRVDQSFRLLAGGRRTAVERHQTLRAAIDWSYELLTPAEQLLLDRLSVFAGGFTLEAVELVTVGDGVDADDVFDLLASLVARSLVVAETDDLDARYRLLETIRQYAQEHLDGSGDGDLLRSRHAVYYAEFAQSAIPMFIGAEGLGWQHRFERDLDNLRAALSWAVETHDVDPAIRLVAAWSSPFTPLDLSVRSTLRWAAETVLDLPGASEHAGYPAALVMAAWTAHWQGDLKLARRRCDEAIQSEQRLGTDPSPSIWHVRSQIALAINDLDDALDCISRSAEIFRARGDTAMLSFALGSSAATRALLGDSVRAIPEAEEALALANRGRVNPALMVGTMAVVAFALGDSDPPRALALVRDALARIGPGERSYAWAVGGDLAVRNGEPTQALEYFMRSIDDMHWFGNRPILGLSIGRVADLIAESNAEAGAVLHGAADLLAPEFVQATHVIEARERAVAAETASLGAARRAQSYARGVSMDEDEIVAFAQAASAEYLGEGHIDPNPRRTNSSLLQY